MSITKLKLDEDVWGGFHTEIWKLTLDSSYPTNGYTAALGYGGFGIKTIRAATVVGISALGSGIVLVEHDFTNNKLMAFRAAAATGTIAAPTFTGTAPISDLNLATPAFSGTGLTASSQVITTTDNQTMTVNQCAGMWLLSATGATPPNLILSNTAVTGAPAVLTVQGAASTDAGAYKIVKALTPIGTNSAPAFTGSAQEALAEAANGTNLSGVIIRLLLIGRK